METFLLPMNKKTALLKPDLFVSPSPSVCAFVYVEGYWGWLAVSFLVLSDVKQTPSPALGVVAVCNTI